MDLKLDPYTIGGVIAISAGGYLIIKAYNNYIELKHVNNYKTTLLFRKFFQSSLSLSVIFLIN